MEVEGVGGMYGQRCERGRWVSGFGHKVESVCEGSAEA